MSADRYNVAVAGTMTGNKPHNVGPAPRALYQHASEKQQEYTAIAVWLQSLVSNMDPRPGRGHQQESLQRSRCGWRNDWEQS
jgi:aromatic ring-cleaving dioxygenase